MNLHAFQISWFDFAVLLAMLIGVARGRRNGMSGEVLDVLKWMAIVFVAGSFYEALGDLMSANTTFNSLPCYVFSYTVLALLVIGLFSAIRQKAGGKLLGSDTFGGMEYYLGMGAGAARYVCILFVGLALLNARQYSDDELRRTANYQAENFGEISFPTVGSFQQEVFDHSWTGRLTREYFDGFLIRQTAPEERTAVGRNNLVRARTRALDQVLEKQ